MDNRKYSFFDIDGTLGIGTSGVLPQTTVETLRELRERGHFIAIASGRLQADTARHAERIGISNFVADGGNSLTLDGECIWQEPMVRQDCIDLLEECERKGVAWAVTDENVNVRKWKSGEALAQARNEHTPDLVVPGLDFHRCAQFYKLHLCCTEEQARKLENLKKITYVRYSGCFLILEPTDKARGIKKMMDHFGAPYGQVVVFGDGTNDISMFRKEWISVAMGNACRELKERANFITRRVEEDGIQYACRRFGWIA